MKNFKKLSLAEKVWFFAPFAVWFSYYPNFHFGKAGGANLEFSIALIYAVILMLFGVKNIFKNRSKLMKNKAVILTGFFIFWNFITILFSQNQLRSFLVSGVWLVLWLDFLTILTISKNIKLMKICIQNFIFSAFFMSIFAIIQVIYGTWFDWGLCAGCVAQGFGFVRPSVFMIEPQFFASILLVPILVILSRIFSKKSSKKEFFAIWVMLFAMYLTLSRGAIFAMFAGILLLIFVNQKFSKTVVLRNMGVSILLIFSSFSVGMIFHGIFTELNPRINDRFYDSISKSVNQMSLGKITLPKNEKVVNSKLKEPEIENDNLQGLSVEKPVENSKKAYFDGYVKKSTDERVKMSDLAIKTWLSNPFVIAFGVGSGSAGTAIFKTTHQISNSSEIVQNEFLSILLELGFFGFIVWILIIFGIIRKTRNDKYIWAIIFAFLIQWFFFSGLPNVLHIYLILATIFAIIEKAYEK